MKILAARVDPMEGWANPPALEVLVDRRPPHDELRYRVVREGPDTFYFAELDGYVSFFVHRPRDERGYGGAVFTPTLEDGTVVKVPGPWSSRPAQMEPRFGVASFEVRITDDPRVFERRRTFYAGTITVDKAREALALCPDSARWSLQRVEVHGERPFEIVEVPA